MFREYGSRCPLLLQPQLVGDHRNKFGIGWLSAGIMDGVAEVGTRWERVVYRVVGRYDTWAFIGVVLL